MVVEHAEIKRVAKQVSAAKRGAAKHDASRAGEAAWKAARQGKKSLREAHAVAERAAFEAFRQMPGERHEAIRERTASFTRDDGEPLTREPSASKPA